ncbi:helix-turn-helix domain-containing protein [Microvirga calopogonii]|uniref:helix-turn-helix domain-containing protein n=1 Tax=Microvirga calopogonii TaxID=2078013 RepID=UPI000E0DE0F6|nr:helix-turn-helix domain-containing protein [Microvirga calopogonii]
MWVIERAFRGAIPQATRASKTARLISYPLEEAVAIGHKDLDRLSLARALKDRVTRTCRGNSKLPDLAELFPSRPLVTVPLGAKLLKVTPRAFNLMLAQLGGARPRGLSGRTRYRAWGIV